MSSPAAVGRVLGGRYRLTTQIARGGMATVWVGDDTLLARRVAVKTLHPELAVHADVRTRFRNEAVAAAGLAHPGIVATYDTGEDDGDAFIVMELVEGPNLRRVLDERAPLPIGEAVRVARGVATALDHAHRHGIVHRDVKPANVLVPHEGPVKVTDFGIAKAAGADDLTRSGTVLGTARYLAPEQVRGEPADPRSDIYAVGLLLHEMLAGSLPFHGETEMATALARLGVAPDPLPPTVPPGVASITSRCLALDPADRYPNAHALAGALEAVAGSSDLPPAPPPAPPPARDVTAPNPVLPPARPHAARPTSRRHTWPWVILGGLLLAGGAGGGYVLVRQVVEAPERSTVPTAAAPQVAAVADFDPEGDNREENPELVPRVVDGDGTSAWATETYRSADFGGTKSGVGVRLDLAARADISFVEVDALEDGWSADVYVADTPADVLGGWGPARASGAGLARAAQFSIEPPVAGSSVLVWFTKLPDSGKLDVAEIRVG